MEGILTILTIDFEASCLPRHGLSYPIEVGIAREGKARSWLIRPHDDWAGWHWSAEAEALHGLDRDRVERSEEHTSELQSLMRISYAVFCLKKKKKKCQTTTISI